MFNRKEAKTGGGKHEKGKDDCDTILHIVLNN